jgi:hypothetical protein
VVFGVWGVDDVGVDIEASGLKSEEDAPTAFEEDALIAKTFDDLYDVVSNGASSEMNSAPEGILGRRRALGLVEHGAA